MFVTLLSFDKFLIYCSSDLLKALDQRLFINTDTKASVSFPLSKTIGGYLRHSYDFFCCRSFSCCVFGVVTFMYAQTVQLWTMFSVSVNIFFHIPDSVALAQYNTKLRLLKKFQYKSNTKGRNVCTIYRLQTAGRCEKLKTIPLKTS